MANNPGRVVTQCQFSDIFSHAWAEAMIPRNICAGFKAAGVYPLDTAAFIVCTASSDITDSPAHSSSLEFVPMYSHIAPKSRRTQLFTQKEEHFQQRDMTFPMIPNIFHGSTFIILMKLSIFVN